MIDNGLLKKYFQNKRISKQGPTISVDKNFKSITSTTLVDSKGEEKSFYCKICDKYQADAEVLLSQVYAKAGLTSAIYLPAVFKRQDGEERSGVVSNDVKTTPRQNAFIKDFFELNGYLPSNFPKVEDALTFQPRIRLPHKLDFAGRLEEFFENDKFTKQSIRQMTKARLFDVASFNTDRHYRNYYYKFDENGKPCDIVLFDNGYSGLLYRGFVKFGQEVYANCNNFYNDFAMFDIEYDTRIISNKSREEMVEGFRQNESMQEYITPRELVETLEQVDVKATARDIYDTIGYKIDEKYVDTIAESFENLAEEVSRA